MTFKEILEKVWSWFCMTLILGFTSFLFTIPLVNFDVISNTLPGFIISWIFMAVVIAATWMFLLNRDGAHKKNTPPKALKTAYYSTMEGREKKLFESWFYFLWLVRACFWLSISAGLAYWIIPENFIEVRLADWTLAFVFRLLAGLLICGATISLALWPFTPRSDDSWSNHELEFYPAILWAGLLFAGYLYFL